MEIQENYEKVLQRIRLKENENKYSHLINAPSKTPDEQQLHNDILTLGMYVELLNKQKVQTPPALLESGCRILLKRIEEKLNENGWK